MTNLTKENWIEILQDNSLTNELNLKIFQTMYGFPNHKAAASEIGKILGYEKSPASPLNLEIGRYGKRISGKFDISLTIRENRKFKYWDIFFDGDDGIQFFFWILKPNLRLALEKLELTGEVLITEELNEINTILHEGIKKKVTINSYERNSKARELCIKHWGDSCAVCSFNFENIYGKLGKGYIHVHHIIPISEVGTSYEINPKSDLIPVCPNCHSMIHCTRHTLSIQELKKIIKK